VVCSSDSDTFMAEFLQDFPVRFLFWPVNTLVNNVVFRSQAKARDEYRAELAATNFETNVHQLSEFLGHVMIGLLSSCDVTRESAAEVLRKTRIMHPEFSEDRQFRFVLDSGLEFLTKCLGTDDDKREVLRMKGTGRLIQWLERLAKQQFCAASHNDRGPLDWVYEYGKILRMKRKACFRMLVYRAFSLLILDDRVR